MDVSSIDISARTGIA